MVQYFNEGIFRDQYVLIITIIIIIIITVKSYYEPDNYCNVLICTELIYLLFVDY